MSEILRNHSGGWAAFCERLFAQNQFAIKLGLENMRHALSLESERLGACLQGSHPAILIAGTNGKGSTAAYIGAILQSHGLRVGLYTSPHLVDFRERFRVDGRLLPEDQVERIGREVLERYGNVEGDNPCLTFFELTTLMAVRLFHENGADVGVYEIGLGGRLDAVNVLEPSVSVITGIDFDHEQYLGTTIEAIAGEKCGIFRPQGRAVVGFQEHELAMRAIEARAAADTLFYGRDFSVMDEIRGQSFQEILGSVSEVTLHNARTAFEASRSYLQGAFDEGKAIRGLQRMRWPGRLDWRGVQVGVGRGEPVSVRFLLDAAHNEASVRALFAYLERADIVPGAVVVGAMADKALGLMFERLGGLGWPVFGVEIDNSRAADGAQLQAAVNADEIWRGAGTCGWALEAASREVGESGRPVLVFGSIYLLGEFFSQAGISAESLVTYYQEEEEA